MESKVVRNYNAEKVGMRIKKIRKMYGDTQAELAEYLDLSDDSIYKIEHGKQTCMPDCAARICDRYYVNADYLYYGLGIEDVVGNNVEIDRINNMLKICSRNDLERIEQLLKLFLKI